jgi:glycosyltransferase involved in cell wall biosynthesis
MLDIDKLLANLSVVIVSHIALTGHSQELENFLKKRVQKLVFIGHPFFYAKQKSSFAVIYEKGVIKSKIEAPKIIGHEIILYLKDFILTFYFIFRLRYRFDIYFGVDPLNALAGLLLKRFGIVRIVVFYVIDYVPIRFKSVILNNIYHFVDRICVSHADYTWNLTSAMANARARRGINNRKTNQMIVPTGTNLRYKPIEEIDRVSVVFLSHLREGQGIELILDAMPIVVEKFPAVKLLIIGTGPLEEYFKKEVEKKNLNNNIFFLGYIESHEEIEKIISKCRIGIAPYVPDPNSFTWYADPGKPKVYLGCGVPVIITKVPEVAFEIEKWGAGIAIDYNKDELADAILKLLTNDKFYYQSRQRAIEFASNYTWDNVFYRAFKQMFINKRTHN